MARDAGGLWQGRFFDRRVTRGREVNGKAADPRAGSALPASGTSRIVNGEGLIREEETKWDGNELKAVSSPPMAAKGSRDAQYVSSLELTHEAARRCRTWLSTRAPQPETWDVGALTWAVVRGNALKAKRRLVRVAVKNGRLPLTGRTKADCWRLICIDGGRLHSRVNPKPSPTR
jgi:hypothetical protein